ncbi:MAG: IS4 family transposase [Agriterribacter sp.]
MTAKELIGLIPEEIFEELSAETKVDTQVKKLSGEVIFKLILFSMLNTSKPSLRVMEAFLQSAQFKSFTGYDILDGKYNSIRDRICTINADYFAKLFEQIFLIYNKELKEEKALSKADSTYVALASKLFSTGMENGTNDKRFVKYSVNLKGSIPSSVKVFTTQSYVSEELALTEVINDTDCIKNDVVVFDRGLQSRESFDKFTNSQKWFVSRANPNIRCKTNTRTKVEEKPKSSTVTIVSDEAGYLINKKDKATAHIYRVIKAVINKSGEPICFVTNIINEDAYLIAAWYKQRWEIEVFFKFIKQHLNVNHLVSRNINGIKVMIYMTMILAILIIAYKKINRIKGFKIAKLKFELELETEIMKAVVILCGGNPDNAPHLFSSA